MMEEDSGRDNPARIPCAACLARGKTWQGSDPTCSFPDGGEFSPDGWNCATANEIRDLMPRWEEPDSERVSKPRWNEDQYWATVDLVDIELPSGYAECLWVGWYKNRGRTEEMWLLGGREKPERPTLADARAILDAIATEARRAETTGSVEDEGAAIAQTPQGG